ncbi:MAG TPA: cytochrome c oxidase subunit II [Jeotgalicoccus sp.]|nr:cytochrome c oxidase subunit II [Jeotgalicoccus sp.]
MKNSWTKTKFIMLMSVLTMFLAGCGENHLSTLKPAGEVGRQQFNLMVISIVIMILVIVVVTVAFSIAVFKSRRSQLGEDFKPKQVAGNHTLEVIWTSIPIVLLIILAIPTVYFTFHQGDTTEMVNAKGEANEDVTIINVTAHQYWWEFEYEHEGVVTSQDLVVPTGEKVFFNLKGADVKHSFWIPAAGGKLDTNVDGVNSFFLVFDDDKAQDADRLFYGKCAELCGPSHALMDFKVNALEKDDYEQWLADMKQIEEPIQADAGDAKEGQEIFNNSCIGCHAVTPTGAGAVGPNLTNFGDRELVAGILEHNKENLVDWIKDPESIKPGNKMTGKYQLNDEEIEKVAEYLMTLKVDEGTGDKSKLRESKDEEGGDK